MAVVLLSSTKGSLRALTGLVFVMACADEGGALPCDADHVSTDAASPMDTDSGQLPLDSSTMEPIDMGDAGTEDRDATSSTDSMVVEPPAPNDAGTTMPPSSGASEWIIAEFADDPVMTGDFTRRTTVETPTLVRDATGCCGKYAFFIRNDMGPDDLRVGFVNVTIRDLTSSDAYGAGIGTTRSFPGVELFLSDVEIEPNWPQWRNYDSTNYDGIVLDGSEAIYAEDLTIRNYNADTSMDIKSNTAQLVRLTVEGAGHRALRFWRDGPHYLVDSDVDNPGTSGQGALAWFSNCNGVTLRVYDSRFNGESTIPSNRIACDNGSNPNIEYLDTDPRTTGEMHPMFTP